MREGKKTEGRGKERKVIGREGKVEQKRKDPISVKPQAGYLDI